jgi:hypothetical protein
VVEGRSDLSQQDFVKRPGDAVLFMRSEDGDIFTDQVGAPIVRKFTPFAPTTPYWQNGNLTQQQR